MLCLDSKGTHPQNLCWYSMSVPQHLEIKYRAIREADISIVVHGPGAYSRQRHIGQSEHDFRKAVVQVATPLWIFHLFMPTRWKHIPILDPLQEKITGVCQVTTAVGAERSDPLSSKTIPQSADLPYDAAM